MTLAELQRALTAVEPAAVLVPPRVMEKVIRQVLQLSAMVWSVPHRNSWIVDRTLLFRHVDQGDLALATDQILPSTVILLSWPLDDDLHFDNAGNVLLQTWRQLFHATLHQAVEHCWETGLLTLPRLREFIDTVGPTAFEEIQTVLHQENILLGEANERALFNEFVAVFLELHHFAPTLLPTYFPGLGDPAGVKRMLDAIIPSDAILQRTRLPGAPEPLTGRETRPSEANEFFHELELSSERSLQRGNVVQAAIELQRAARVAPGDKAPATRKKAEHLLEELLDRFCRALDLPEVERHGWGRLLPILLEKSDQGSRPAEAGLLHEIQKVCLDHEREIYKLDIGEWLMSAGRRPIQRPLPSQRIVRISRTLRGALTYLTSARLSDQDRAELEGLLQRALHRSEERVRARFRPILSNALHDVGLVPRNPIETTACHKMVEELLDRILAYGFLTFSDLRDTISRNQMKLPDLSDPQDFIRGDPLIRLDRRLSTVLDGVYRPGEFYLRWLERFTSFNFGTRIGRALTRFVTLPVGGGFLLLEAVLLLHHFGQKVGANRDMVIEPEVEPAVSLPVPLYYSLWVFFALTIFGLLHSPPLRERIYRALASLGLALRSAFVDMPLRLVRQYSLNKILMSSTFQLVWWYLVKPALLTLLLTLLYPELRSGWFPVVTFFAATGAVNTRPGEAFWEMLVKAVQNLFRLLRSGLIPGLFGFIVRAYKQVLHSIEGLLFTVDEWLRFRGGESRQAMVLRTVVTLFWLPVSYLARFNLVVFIEPCLHPLKLPVCSVAAKFIYPFVPVIKPVMTEWTQPILGTVLTEPVVWWVVFWLPDVFGFIFWEMKENWTLYRANRGQGLAPVAIGSHGETIRTLFQPGFHSGTLPRLFTRVRHAELVALKSGNYSHVRLYRADQLEIEEMLSKFVLRELCSLLEQSPSWRGQGLEPGRVELSSNQIRIFLTHPQHPEAPLLLALDFREGWIVARLEACLWLDELDAAARRSLHNALIVFYKLADVDLIREHLRTLLPSPQDHFDITPYGLTIWPPDRQGPPLNVHLLPYEPEEGVAVEGSTLTWDPQRVLFSERRLNRDECLRAWNEREPPQLLPDIQVLPSAAAAPAPPASDDLKHSIIDFKKNGAIWPGAPAATGGR